MDPSPPWLRHPFAGLALFVLLAAALAPGLARLRLDNTPERFLVRDAEALREYRRFELDFGRDRTLRLVVTGDGLSSAAGRAWTAALDRRAAALQGVMAALGPRLDGAPDPLELQAGLVSEDGRLATVLVALYRLDRRRQEATMASLDRLLATAPAGLTTAVAGLPGLQAAVDAALGRVVRTTFPWLLVLAVLLLALLLGRATDAVVPLVLVALVMTPLFGLMALLGVALDLVTVLLVGLLFVVGCATAVHVQVRYLTLTAAGAAPAAALRRTYAEKTAPVLWSGLTTGAGFGSLVVSPVEPVRALGAWAAAGIALLTLAVFVALPGLLRLAGRGRSGAVRRQRRRLACARRFGTAAAGWAVVHRRRVLALAAGIVLLAAAGLPRLRVETGAAGYLPPDHPARTVLRDLQRAGVGAVAAELALTAGDGAPPFTAPRRLAALRRLAEDLRGGPQVLGAAGLADLEAAAARGADVAKLRPFFVTADGRRTRLSLFVPLTGGDALEPLFRRVRTAAAVRFPDAEVVITGRFPMVLAAQASLLRTVVRTLALTAVCVAALLWLYVRDAGLAVRALLPNLAPALLVLGVMGWSGVAVDSTTVIIAAVVLGLVVDDTLHTMAAYRRLVRRLPPRRAAPRAVARLAGAHVTSSSLLTAGFLLLAACGFPPLARFGALASLAVVAALAADLWLVPALLAGMPARSA